MIGQSQISHESVVEGCQTYLDEDEARRLTSASANSKSPVHVESQETAKSACLTLTLSCFQLVLLRRVPYPVDYEA